MSQKIRKVVFPVAGMGTRFLPATKAVPKEMLPVFSKPLIQWSVEEATEAGITEFIFVTSPDKPSIISHFQSSPAYEAMLQERNKTEELELLKAGLPDNAKITEVSQDKPLGLGHAIWCAKEAVGNEPVAVILPDDMVQHTSGCLKQMVDAYEKTGGNLVAVENVPTDQTYRYGILDPETDDGQIVKIRGMVEKPAPEDAPSDLAIIGRYILDPMIMETLDKGKTGAGGEIQITDAMADLIGTCPLHGLRFEGTRYDCGNKVGFLAANLAYAALDPELVDGLQEQIRTIFK
ncbi:MAG: UTP--glucose-1-phosphate uridylyltransferase GalU [Candidatus Micropelagos sp.]|uniref:UTP--glucose-1-phosphate uridylyltransferase n=1 Tax=PS1 clade bacterium TaxID=2175152 RepID=A0A368EL71_9PROT|nr:MAG: UTP--glucose-1-phosphate uridylyltransferase [PS1 clade bacterium]HCN31523.1 UTP--glucose-1-phosphate uridylyltransferase [Rhodobiaceae bacterium]